MAASLVAVDVAFATRRPRLVAASIVGAASAASHATHALCPFCGGCESQRSLAGFGVCVAALHAIILLHRLCGGQKPFCAQLIVSNFDYIRLMDLNTRTCLRWRSLSNALNQPMLMEKHLTSGLDFLAGWGGGYWSGN